MRCCKLLPQIRHAERSKHDLLKSLTFSFIKIIIYWLIL